MFSYFSPQLLTEQGIQAFGNMEVELEKLQTQFPDNDVIHALLKLLGLLKHEKATILTAPSSEIDELRSIIDNNSGYCAPSITNEATFKIAEIFFTHGQCFIANHEDKHIPGFNSKVISMALMRFKYNVVNVTASIVAIFQIEKRIYSVSKLAKTMEIKRILGEIKSFLIASTPVLLSPVNNTNIDKQYKALIDEFFQMISTFGNLQASYLHAGTILVREKSRAYSLALNMECKLQLKNKISPDNKPIYRFLKVLVIEEKVQHYNEECIQLLQDFEAKLRVYIKTKPDAYKAEHAESILRLLSINNIQVVDGFSQVMDFYGDINDRMPRTPSGRLYEILLDFRYRMMVQLEKCDIRCDAILLHQILQYESQVSIDSNRSLNKSQSA